MNREAAYLQIPEGYFRGMVPGSPRWSGSGEALEWPDGSTLAFGGEVALFLEGYAYVGRPIHFAHVVHLLAMVDPGRELTDRSDSERLVRAFRAEGRPLRNFGALCGWLCRDVPPLAEPPSPGELCLKLSSGSLLRELSVGSVATAPLGHEVEGPSLDAVEFAARFVGALAELSPQSITDWLRHGRGTGPDRGGRLAEGIEALRPRTLEGALAALSGRERLRSAMPIVAQLVSALTLPPRRLAHQSLPTGGYADVATRGNPERILPSQFAFDGEEFIRRFAENELLYFHREEPHAPITEELVILIDQGVRTWGRVRHALTASALAFARLAARRKLPLLVGGTSGEGALLDPVAVGDDPLVALWEASDLTTDPSSALARVLETSWRGRGRDVVVLTTPRGVLGPGFEAASRLAPEGTRVFTVAVDESWKVEFREWRRGSPVKVGDFRIAEAPESAGPDLPKAARPAVGPAGWAGDVEPIGYPFRFGVIHRIERPLFDFDHAGRRLLLATRRGLLQGWDLETSKAEVLPRGMIGGEPLEEVDAVLGVAGGFVVGGRVGKSLAVVHYDFEARKVSARAIGPTLEQNWAWFYSGELHTAVARGKTYSRAFDLATGEVHRSRDSKDRPPPRAIRAFEMASNHALPPPRLVIVDEGTPPPERGRSIRLDRDSGEIRLFGVTPPWEPFIPRSNGNPSLRGFWIDHAQLRGDVLALVVSGPARRGAILRLFHAPAGASNRELPAPGEPGSFILSHDGRLLARRLGERQVEVREVSGSGQPVFVTPKGKTHTDLKLTLGRYGMIAQVGRHVHLIRWDRGVLATSNHPDGPASATFAAIPWPIDRPATRSTPRPRALDYDVKRFAAAALAELTAVVDAFGQIILFDRHDALIAMFVVFRGQVAAWMPDGTRFGPAHGPNPLIEGPVTPDAARIIGAALKAASDAGMARTSRPSPR